MSFQPSHRIQLAEMFNFLGSNSQVRSSLGGQIENCRAENIDGVFSYDPFGGNAEQDMIDMANISHCVSELEKQQSVRWAPTDVLPKFAIRTRQRPGAVAVSVVRLYQPWYCDPDARRPAGTDTLGVIRGPDRGLADVYDWLISHDPALGIPPPKGMTRAEAFRAGDQSGPKDRAARLVADADIVVGAWVDLWNSKSAFKNHLSVQAFCERYGLSLATVQRWCANGKLEAVMVGNSYKIDVTSLDESYMPS